MALAQHSTTTPRAAVPPCLRAFVPACLLLFLPSCTPDTAEPQSPTTILAEVGHSPGQLVFPRCLDQDSTGALWVVDKTARIQRLDPRTGKATALWHTPQWDDGKPCGITIAPTTSTTEALYVADTHYFRVLVYAIPPLGFGTALDADESLRPELLASFGSYGTGPGQLIYPTDVAVLTSDQGKPTTLYVSEYGGNDRISLYDGNSLSFLTSVGSFSTDVTNPAELELSRPQSIAIDQQRQRLVVTDTCHHRVGVLTLDGRVTRWIGGPGAGRDQLAYPHGLALLPDGSALISEVGNHRIKRINLDTGATIDTLGIQGQNPGQLVSPWAVVADLTTRTAWVLDSGNNRLQAFDLGRLDARRTARTSQDAEAEPLRAKPRVDHPIAFNARGDTR